MSVPVCVSVCVIRTAENSRNIAPVTCCIILGARGDSPGWFISMERCLPVFEESKIEQYKACQGKKIKKSVFPPHTLHCNGGIAASLSAWLTWLIFFLQPTKNKNNGRDFYLWSGCSQRFGSLSNRSTARCTEEAASSTLHATSPLKPTVSVPGLSMNPRKKTGKKKG